MPSDRTDADVPSSESAASSGVPGLPKATRFWERFVDQAEPTIFEIACALLVLLAARFFYRALHGQTGGDWSAPLDDAFIHFDYARSAARGHPFQWSEGNGFSSGGTSLTYPLILAVGYVLGFREGNGGGAHIMQWAAFVAVVSTFSFLRAASRLAAPMGRWARYVVPATVLSLGALNWSLWSGMETAWLLALWAAALFGTLSATGDWKALAPGGSPAPPKRTRAFVLPGLLCLLLAWTRPEAVVCVLAFAAWAGVALHRARGLRHAAAGASLTLGPAALGVLLQTFLNARLTGEWAPAGAIAKLVWYDPNLASHERWVVWGRTLRYLVGRLTQYHFADPARGRWGWIVPVVALLPLASPKLRRVAILLWSQALLWLAVTASNQQVVYQNERWAMPAAAWIFVLFALGLAMLFSRTAAGLVRAPGDAALERGQHATRALLGACAALAFASVQLPRFWDQAWFFGRASRNIRDQHVTVGKTVARIGARRILVTDAGAIPFAADIAAVDLVGLGGYHAYPFARASREGVGASLELLEAMPPEDRPDVMAIYPAWWGDLATVFGRRLFGVTAAGNVICGAPEKVVYRTEWDAFDRRGRPFSVDRRDKLVDELDVALLPQERSHHYQGRGTIRWRVLPHPTRKGMELFDAGRLVADGHHESFVLKAPTNASGRLVLRTVTDASVRVVLRVEGVDADVGEELIPESRGWVEVTFPLPKGLPSPMRMSLHASSGDLVNHHLWVVESP